MKIFENFDLTGYNSYRLSARCARAFFPRTEDEVRDVYSGYPGTKYLIGSGHNIILARDWYDDNFVIFNGNFNRIAVEGTVMEAEAGAFSSTMSEVALLHGLSGLEMFYDIPSSLGGAVVMNAGASGEEIKNLLLSVRYLDLHDLVVREIDVKDANFSYRNSLFQQNQNQIVLAARLQLQPSDRVTIRDKMDFIKEARWAKQPRDLPNAGSVFKRPAGRFVGPMLDELGLKGIEIGGFQVSEKHSGFIVRHAEATAQDLLMLINHIQKLVRERYGVELELEQRIIL